jgi:hypothetical protein
MKLKKKMNLIKSPPKITNRNIKEWGPNAKLKNKRGNNINWFKGKIKKKIKHFIEEIKKTLN